MAEESVMVSELISVVLVVSVDSDFFSPQEANVNMPPISRRANTFLIFCFVKQ